MEAVTNSQHLCGFISYRLLSGLLQNAQETSRYHLRKIWEIKPKYVHRRSWDVVHAGVLSKHTAQSVGICHPQPLRSPHPQVVCPRARALLPSPALPAGRQSLREMLPLWPQALQSAMFT